MNKTIYKVISCLLIAVLLSGIMSLAGCKKSEQADSNSESEIVSSDEVASDENSSTNEETNSSNVSSNVSSNEQANKYDLKGRKIQIINTGGLIAPSTQKEKAYFASLEKEFNCKVEFINLNWSSVLKTFTTKTLAGEAYGDLVRVDTAYAYPNFMINNIAMPLDDYFDFSLPCWNNVGMNAYKVNEKNYMAIDEKFLAGWVVFFNKSIFKKAGTPTPYEYIDNNTWNWDNFLKAAKACTMDTNKDGTNDIWGLGAEWRCPSNPVALMYSNGGHIIETVNGQPKFALNSAQAIKGIQFAYDLMWTHNVCEPVPAGQDAYGFWQRQWTAGKCAMYIGQNYTITEFREALKDSGIGVAYLPKGPDAKDYVNIQVPLGGMVMNKYSKNPKEVAAFWTKWCMYKHENYDAKEFYSTGKLYAEDEKGVEVLANAATKYTVPEWFQTYEWVRDNVGYSTLGVTNKQSPQAFVETVQKAAEKDIMLTWKKTN